MKILTLSDKVDELVYSSAIKQQFSDVDLVLGCGDLPHHYLEFVVTMLGGPLFYVIGNHGSEVRQSYDPTEHWQFPGGCENIDGRAVRYRELLIAGLEGSMRYNNNRFYQYTEWEMSRRVWRLAPALVLNRLLHGRYLDILITHAPPRGIHDRPDLCHRGFEAFLKLMDRFRPRYLIHGHIHLYGPEEPTETMYGDTQVINTYGYRVLEIEEESLQRRAVGSEGNRNGV